MLRPWIVQWYGYVPATGNVASNVPDAKSEAFAGAPAFWSKVTLCVTPVVLLHVTVDPAFTVIDAGSNVLLGVRQTVDAPGVQLLAVPGSPYVGVPPVVVVPPVPGPVA